MNFPVRFWPKGRAATAISTVLLATAFSPAVYAAVSTVMPDTAAGKLGGTLIRHINSDGAQRIQ